MYFTFYKLAEGLFLTEDLHIARICLYFSEELGFSDFAQLIIQIHGDFLHKCLIIMIPHHFLDVFELLGDTFIPLSQKVAQQGEKPPGAPPLPTTNGGAVGKAKSPVWFNILIEFDFVLWAEETPTTSSG